MKMLVAVSVMAVALLVLRISAKSPYVEIVAIGTDTQSSALPSWQKRRFLAEIISALSRGGAKAIVVTEPCIGYTSTGADKALINSVKDSDSVYFSAPAWDPLFTYSRGIGHMHAEKSGDEITIPEFYTYDGKAYPALSLLLSEAYFDKRWKGSLVFKGERRSFIGHYPLDKATALSQEGVFKNKICFVGKNDDIVLQAQALSSVIYDAGGDLSKAGYFLIPAIILLLAALFFIIAFKRQDLSLFRKKNISAHLPKNSSRLAFGLSYYIPGNTSRSIFEFRRWHDDRYWLCMGDFYTHKEKQAAHLENIRKSFFALNEGIGPREAMLKLNSLLCKEQNGSFTNLIFMDIRPQERILNFSNAGFESPLLFLNSSKQFREFSNISMPLGIKRDILIDEEEIALKKYDIFLLYNSGIVKSRDKNGQLLDLQQLKYMVTQNSNLPPKNITSKIFKVILDFNWGRPSMDALLLAIKGN